MKIKDLIKLLSELPPDAQIYIANDREDYMNIGVEAMLYQGKIVAFTLIEVPFDIAVQLEPIQLNLPFGE